MSATTQAMLRKWAAVHGARLLPQDTGAAFAHYVNSLPWGVSELDWSRMPPSVAVELLTAGREQRVAWLATASIGRHDHAGLWFPSLGSGLVLPIQVWIDRLDEIYSGAPGAQFAFGVDVLPDSSIRVSFGDLAEHTVAELTGTARPAPAEELA